MKCYSYLSILALCCSLLAGCTCSKKHCKETSAATSVDKVVTESKEIGNDVKEIGIEDIDTEPMTDIDIIDVPQDTDIDIETDIVPYYEEEEFIIITDSKDQNSDDEFQMLIEDKE